MSHYATTTDSNVGIGSGAQAEPEMQAFRAILLIIIALCTYTHVPLMSGGRLLVPSFPTFALAPLLFLTVRKSLTSFDIVFLPKVAFVLLVSIALSPGYQYVDEKFLGLVQCCMALAVALLIVKLMLQLRHEVLERTLFVLWCLILVGSTLEVLGVIKEASDSFREWAFQEQYGLYDSDMRDTNLVGWVRPKLFSTEPSHVTKAFMVLVNAWLLVRVTRIKAMAVAGATLAMLLIMGSPMLLISVAITLTALVWNSRASVGARIATVAATLVVGIALVTLFGGSTYTKVASRIDDVSIETSEHSWRGTSEQQRMVFPYVTLMDTWSRWPLFGVGISGKEVAGENSSLRIASQYVLGNNALAEIGTYLGIVGGAWFVYLLGMHARRTGVRRLSLYLAIAALFSQAMGGIDSIRYWGFIALFWGAIAAADSKLSPRDAERMQREHGHG